jgi:hypothetical protein
MSTYDALEADLRKELPNLPDNCQATIRRIITGVYEAAERLTQHAEALRVNALHTEKQLGHTSSLVVGAQLEISGIAKQKERLLSAIRGTEQKETQK